VILGSGDIASDTAIRIWVYDIETSTLVMDEGWKFSEYGGFGIHFFAFGSKLICYDSAFTYDNKQMVIIDVETLTISRVPWSHPTYGSWIFGPGGIDRNNGYILGTVISGNQTRLAYYNVSDGTWWVDGTLLDIGNVYDALFFLQGNDTCPCLALRRNYDHIVEVRDFSRTLLFTLPYIHGSWVDGYEWIIPQFDDYEGRAWFFDWDNRRLCGYKLDGSVRYISVPLPEVGAPAYRPYVYITFWNRAVIGSRYILALPPTSTQFYWFQLYP
jgi:hypothetical protein